MINTTDLIVLSIVFGGTYALFMLYLIAGRAFLFSPWYDKIAFRHPDSKFKLTGPYTGKTVWLYVHRENPEDVILQALAIKYEMKLYAAALQKQQ